MGRDSHCNLPPNKTHSYSSQLIVDPNTFAIQHKCSKNRVSASIQGRYFSVFRDIPNSLKNEKMILQKSLHPQFGDCMAKQQLIKSHNIAGTVDLQGYETSVLQFMRDLESGQVLEYAQ